VVLVAAQAMALLWALRWPMNRSLGLYLGAQLVYILPVELAWRVAGPGKIYGLVYSVFTAIVLLAIWNLVWESMKDCRYRLRLHAIAGLLAVIFTRLAVMGLGRSAEWFDVIALGEGAGLIWGGALIGISAPYSRQPDVLLGLSFLWLTQALFLFGFSLHFPRWDSANDYVPPILTTAGFLYLGWRLKHQQLLRVNG